MSISRETRENLCHKARSRNSRSVGSAAGAGCSIWVDAEFSTGRNRTHPDRRTAATSTAKKERMNTSLFAGI
jgi:hypothetical protein